MKTEIVNVIPKTSNLKSLATLYGVCTKTMAKKIKSIESELGDRKGKRLFMINEVEIIFKHFGTPKIETHVQIIEENKTFLKKVA